MQEAPKLNRKYSLTERHYLRWRSDSVPPEGDHHRHHHHQPQHHSHQAVNTEHTRAHRAAPCTLAMRGRAMSENDLHYDAGRHRWSPAVSMTTSQTLSEVDEGGRESGLIKKKVPPPPRPPPPKWEEFHRRRASHHNLYASPRSSSLSSSPLPPYHSIPLSCLPSNGDSSSVAPVEPSRQRSYSLPPERHQVLGVNQDPEPTGPSSTCGQAQLRLHTRPLASPTANQHQAAQTQGHPFSHGIENRNMEQVQDHLTYSHVVANQNQEQVHDRPYSHVVANQNQEQVHDRPYSHVVANQNQEQVHDRPYSHIVANQNQEQNHNRPRSTTSTNQSPEPFQGRLFAISPTSPMFSRRAFRPVAPPPRERGGAWRSQQEVVQENGDAVLPLPPPPPPPPPSSPPVGSSSWEIQRSPREPEQEAVETVKSLPRHQTDHRPAAQWERKRTPSPRMHCDTSPPPPPPHPTTTTALGNGVVPTSECYVAAGYDQQWNHRGFRNYFGNAGDLEHRGGVTEPEAEPARTESERTLSPSPAHSLEAELNIPMETDIDDYQEEEGGLIPGAQPITSEHPCFALPVTVVETDIDMPPDPEGSSLGRTRAESGSLEEEEELGVRGPGREQLSPQGSEGESGTESWRGAYRGLGHDTDSLDRHSGRSSSCSSHYGIPATRPQISAHRKDASDSRHHDEEEDDLTYKRQLMESLRKKLGVLREAQRGLQEDIRANTQLGEEVESAVVSACKPNEVDKFRMFIGDQDKVVNLLLSLSARLLRTQTSLESLEPHVDQAERPPLVEKKRQLMCQLSEAQDLKEHVDRREQAVGRVLARCLSPDQHRDYCHFVKMKAALLVEQRQLEDKTRLGEEQLRGLRESLDLGLGVGLSLGYGHY